MRIRPSSKSGSGAAGSNSAPAPLPTVPLRVLDGATASDLAEDLARLITALPDVPLGELTADLKRRGFQVLPAGVFEETVGVLQDRLEASTPPGEIPEGMF